MCDHSGVARTTLISTAFLQKLHRLCNQFTILSTTYTDPIIDNHQGCVEITPGSALFLPAVPESHMTVLREDWKKFLQGRPRRRLFPLHQKSMFISIRARL